MNLAPEAAFWISLSSLAYAYLGYPFLMWATSRVSRGSRPLDPAPPASASVVVAAFNEEHCIAEKAQGVLAQGTDNLSIEVIVVSDGSTDSTEGKARAVGDPRIRVLAQTPRQGKNVALNLGVREASGEIVVFTDANAMLAPGALARLLEPFADPGVGLVSGQGLYGDLPQAGSGGEVIGSYTRYECAIRAGESTHGFMAGVDGALYAMRRRLYVDLRSDQVHDLMHPIQVALAGYRCVFVPEAFTLEPPSDGVGREFARQVRIITQGFVLLFVQIPRLLRAARFKEIVILGSHRLLRWLSAFFLASLLLANLALVSRGGVYALTLAGQVAFYGLAALGALGERLALRIPPAAVAFYFCMVSGAGLSAVLQALWGREYAIWAPRGRTGT